MSRLVAWPARAGARAICGYSVSIFPTIENARFEAGGGNQRTVSCGSEPVSQTRSRGGYSPAGSLVACRRPYEGEKGHGVAADTRPERGRDAGIQGDDTGRHGRAHRGGPAAPPTGTVLVR